ncbi:MAG: DUF1963 domain-containing protein [Planctomycetota bacterium]
MSLDPYKRRIEELKVPCAGGSFADLPVALGDSKKGGLPHVDAAFRWPVHNERPMDFLVQLRCADVPLVPVDQGCLLFFWDQRDWGYTHKDAGAFQVVHVRAPDRVASEPPTYRERFLWFFERTRTPKAWRERRLRFEPGQSLPSLDREPFAFGEDDEAMEDYIALQSGLHQPLQVGGFPDPIQSDDMEAECVRLRGKGSEQSWVLLLEAQSTDDMNWGDAGSLYWFIEASDLAEMCFDEVWMIATCH